MAQTEKFLVIEDVDGSIFDPSLVGANKKTKGVTRTLLRGDLLVRDHQSQLAFRSVASPGELVVCPTESLARLTERQFALLLPLQSSSDRFRAYHESLFEAEESFKVNSKVFVHMKDNREFPGVIWYEGIVESLGKGTMFGVELLAEPPQGNVDGSMHGNSYFSCPTNCGIFVSFDKLRLCRDESEFAKKAMEACRGSAERLQKANERQKQHQMRTRSKSRKQKEEKTEATIGTRVMFFSDSGQTFNGTIRWMGKAYYPAPGQPGQILKPIVGIEADSRSAGIVGLGGISSQRQTQFEAQHGGHKVYLPLESVLPLSGHEQRDLRDEELRGSGSRVQQLATKFSENERDVKNTARRPPVTAVETGKRPGGSSVDLPPELRCGMETKDIVEEQKQLLAEAARKKKDGQPVGSASGIDDSKGDYSYVQRQQKARLEKLKGQESRPGKTNSMESLPNQKGNYQWFGSQSRPQAAQNDDKFEMVQKPPGQASAADSHSMRHHHDRGGIHLSHTIDLELDSAVQVQLSKGELVYGTIRWIGELAGEIYAGIELDERAVEGTDGEYNGRRLFSCKMGYGWFTPLRYCHKDSRFDMSPEDRPPQSLSATMRLSEAQRKGAAGGFGHLSADYIEGDHIGYDHALSDDSLGDYKGIQGHHNSCYLDATLFSMFYTTCVFDSIFNRTEVRGQEQEIYEKLKYILKNGIVNPLRKRKAVRADFVMELRKELEKLGSVKGLTHQEKDPEEFLNTLLNQVFKVPYYLKLRSGKNVQTMYYFQLFVEKDGRVAVPTVQHLVEQSFLMSDLKFEEVPAVFLVQMPRFGKGFKMFQKIFPSPKLKITDLLQTSDRKCVICEGAAVEECIDCSKQTLPVSMNPYVVSLCSHCNVAVHKHSNRRKHKPRKITKKGKGFEDEELELFAVMCIETSHYVSFVKFEDGNWVFFDSMADRIGGEDGYNIPRVVACPDLRKWLGNPERVWNEDEIPNPMRRMFSDAYMCMYLSPNRSMYEGEDQVPDHGVA